MASPRGPRPTCSFPGAAHMVSDPSGQSRRGGAFRGTLSVPWGQWCFAASETAGPNLLEVTK
jgi:hypothetical protein